MCVGLPGYQLRAILWSMLGSMLAPRPQRRSLFIHRQPWRGQGRGSRMRRHAGEAGRPELLRA
jgi:hypothetical protein